MAKQHFYARVPAEYSLYNRSDSFDTVAVSEGITRDFVEQEMSFFLENSLTPRDAENIRLSKMPSVYAQYLTKNGTTVQAGISYQEKDFTGERQAYSIHSLILSEEEAKATSRKAGQLIVNPENFVDDVHALLKEECSKNHFSFYPERELKNAPGEATDWLVNEYDSTYVKKFIYGLLSCVCGKTKALYFTFGGEDKEVGEKSLRLMNTILPIFPDFIRSKMSFCTRVSAPGKLNPIKIKGIPAPAMLTIPSGTCYFHFDVRRADGLKDADFEKEHYVVDFLYSLLSKLEQLQEFLNFAHHITDTLPDKVQPTFKVLQEVVTLFLCCSKNYPEKKVLPNDEAMIAFYTAYEKYRTAILDEYRIQGIRSFRRYEEERMEIPQKLFSLVSKIYPAEIPGTQYTVMHVCLSLIHTDLMRDKLFRFLSANYAGSQPDTKEEIVDNLCRVFYGEFLQKQIIEFFLRIFPECSGASHQRILSTMIRSIRVESCQQSTFEFLRVNYPHTTEEDKKMLYDGFLENLRYGDDSSQKVFLFIDGFYPEEPEERKTYITENLLSQLERERSTPKKPLLNLVGSHRFLCCDTAVRQILVSWNGSKSFEAFVEAGVRLPLLEQFAPYLDVLPQLNNPKERKQFLETLANAVLPTAKSVSFLSEMDLYAEGRNREKTAETGEKQNFAEFNQTVSLPLMVATMQEVYRRPEFADNVLTICPFCDHLPEIQSHPNYPVLSTTRDLLNALRERDLKKIVECLPKNEGEKGVRPFMTRALGEELKKNPAEDAVAYFLSALIFKYLEKQQILWQSAFDETATQIEKTAEESDTSERKGKKPSAKNEAEETIRVLKIMPEFASACSGDDVLFPLFTSTSVEMANVFCTVAVKNKPVVLKILADSKAKYASTPKMSKLLSSVTSTVKKKTGILGKLLHL